LRQTRDLASAICHIRKERDLYEAIAMSHLDPRAQTQSSGDTPANAMYERGGHPNNLQPANIVVFEQHEGSMPVFKITPLLGNNLNDLAEAEKSHEASTLKGTESYLGPEGDRMRTRTLDTWAIACVLTELLMWFTQDIMLQDLHQGSRQDRSGSNPDFVHDHYWYQDEQRRHLKPSITTYLADVEELLTKDEHCPVYVLKDLPAIIKSYFMIDPLTRPCAEEV